MTEPMRNVYRLDLSHDELHNIMAAYLVVAALGMRDKAKIISGMSIFMQTIDKLDEAGLDSLTERIGKLHDAAKEQDRE